MSRWMLALVLLSGCQPRVYEGGGTAVGNPARLSVRLPEIVDQAMAEAGWLAADRCDGRAVWSPHEALDLVDGPTLALAGGALCGVVLGHGAIEGDVAAAEGVAAVGGRVAVDGGAFVLELGEPGFGLDDQRAGLFHELVEDGQLDPIERSSGPVAVGADRVQTEPMAAEALVVVGLDGQLTLRSGAEYPDYPSTQGTLPLVDAAFGDGLWVVVGGLDDVGVSLVSEDGGLSWTAHDHGFSLNGVAFADGRFVASSIIGTLEAYDGAWRTLSAPELGYKGVVSGAGGFLAPAGASVAVSADGELWQDAALPGLAGFGASDGVWAGDRWVVVGDLGYRAMSLDGLVWTDETSGGNTLTAVAWDGSEVVAVGVSEGWRSPDGVSWTAADPVALVALTSFRGALLGLDDEGRLYADQAGSWVEALSPLGPGAVGIGSSAP